MTTTFDPNVEPLATSLGRLDEHDWQVLVNAWYRFGDAHFVEKCNGRWWRISDRLGTGWPLCRTKREAMERVSELLLREARHRAWKRRQTEPRQG